MQQQTQSLSAAQLIFPPRLRRPLYLKFVDVAIALVVWIAVCTDIAAAPTPRGAGIYHDYCSVCHGDRGDGNSRASSSLDPAPRNFARTDSDLTRERMILSVTHGRPGTAMTAWKKQLTDQQIAAVVDYIRQAFMQIDLSPTLQRGRAIYAKTCSVCHGDRGNGAMWASSNLGSPPRDFTNAAAMKELTRERMLASVSQGRPGTAMSGFAGQLHAADIAAVVDYIRVSFMHVADATPPPHAPSAQRESTPSVANTAADMQAAMPNGLRGDAERGRKFYQGNCATCHGAKGDGHGPRAYFINPPPRNFLSDPAQSLLNRPAIYAAVMMGKRGTEMPAWRSVLDDQQMADVAEFVFQAFIAPRRANAATR